MGNITGRKKLVQVLLNRGYPVTDNTIYRWEKSGQIPNYPIQKRLKHSRKLVYTDKHIAALIAYMREEEEADV